MKAPWLSVIGIGEDGVEGLSSLARQIIAQAETVIGGERHLKLAASLIDPRSTTNSGNNHSSSPNTVVAYWVTRMAGLNACRRPTVSSRSMPMRVRVPPYFAC